MDELIGSLKIKSAGYFGFDIDIGVDVPIPVTKSIADIKEPQSRQGAYSKTVTIYGEDNINLAFRYIYEINKDITNVSGQFNPDFNPNKRVEIEYSVSGIIQMTGYMRLLNIRKELNTSKIVYECQIFDGAADFWKQIDGKTMADIDLSKYNHTLNFDAIRKSWDQNIFENGVQVPFAYGKGYVHGLINKRPDSTTGFPTTQSWDVGDITPMLYAKELVDAIYAGAGVEYAAGGFFDTAEFKRFVVPYNGVGLQLSDSVVNTNKVIASRTSTQTFTYNTINQNTAGQLIFNNDSTPPNQDLSNSYNTTTGAFTAPIKGEYFCSVYLLFNVTFPNVTTPSNLVIDLQLLNTTKSTFINLTKIVTVTSGTSITFALDGLFNNQLKVDIGDVLVLNIETIFTLTTTFISHTVNVLTDSFVRLQPYSIAYTSGSLVNFNQFLSKEIKQKDFILDLIKTFNLYIDLDETGKHIVKTRDDYYNSDVVDLEPYLNAADEVIYQPMGALDANPYVFDYKADKDSLNDFYSGNYSVNYGRKQYDVDNDFVTTTKKIEVTYSPTVMRFFSDTAMTLPDITFLTKDGLEDKEKKSNYRLLRYEGIKNSNQYTIQDGANTNFMYAYPFISHTDDPDSPTLDCLFGMPLRHYMKPNLPYPNNNLFYRYHLQQYEETTNKNSKLVTATFNINPSLFPRLRFDKLYYFDNSYFRINKIFDYKPYVNTKIEFIKTVNYVKPSSGNGTGNGGNDDFDNFGELFPSGLILNPARGNNNQNAIGDNNTINNNSIAVGSNNQAPNGTVSFLSSNNNFVNPAVSEAVLINTENQTITQNGLYVNGYRVEPLQIINLSSDFDQTADAIGTAKQIEFNVDNSIGADATFASDEITIVNTGAYCLNVNLHVGRITGGSTQQLYTWAELDTGSGYNLIQQSVRHCSTEHPSEVFLVPMEINQVFNAGNKIRLMFSVTDLDLVLKNQSAMPPFPQVYSVNLIFKRVV